MKYKTVKTADLTPGMIVTIGSPDTAYYINNIILDVTSISIKSLVIDSHIARIMTFSKDSYKNIKWYVLNLTKEGFSYVEDNSEPVFLFTADFVYYKNDGSAPTWRCIDVTEETDEYLVGLENDQFKKFLKSRIVEGKIIKSKTPAVNS